VTSYRQINKSQKKLLDNSVTLDLLPSDFEGRLVPIGGVIPIMDNIPGSYTHPGGGAVDKGLMLCDGTAISVGNMNGQNTPNINSDCFLRGSSSSGTTGGANDKAIPAAALPSHTHPVTLNNAGTHGHSASPNGVANMPHIHNQYVTGTSGGPGSRRDNNTPGRRFLTTHTVTSSSNAPHNTPAGTTGASNAPHSHPVTVDNAGTGSTFNIEPSYVTTKYVIRVL